MLKNTHDTTVTVTGAAGYFGAVLCRKLLAEGYRVRAVDNLRYHGEALLGLLDEPGLTFFKSDVRDDRAMGQVCAGADAVVHLAALVGEPVCRINPAETEAVNDRATRSLAKIAAEAGAGLFIFSSTCSNYGKSEDGRALNEEDALQPLSLYSETKIAAEQALLHTNYGVMRAVVLRFATLFGVSPAMRFDLLVQEFVRDAYVTGRLEVYNPQAWRPFLHVADAAEAIVRVLTAGTPSSRVYNVGDEALNSRKAGLADYVLSLVPGAEMLVNDTKADPRDYRVDFSRFADEFDFRATRDLRQGVEQIIRLLRDGIVSDPFSKRFNKV